eukprot:2041429-Prymnesium_polylepis.1
MREAAALRRVLDREAPHDRVVERLQQRPVDLLARRLDARAVPAVGEHERVAEVGLLAARLGVDAHEAEVLPDCGGRRRGALL